MIIYNFEGYTIPMNRDGRARRGGGWRTGPESRHVAYRVHGMPFYTRVYIFSAKWLLWLENDHNNDERPPRRHYSHHHQHHQGKRGETQYASSFKPQVFFLSVVFLYYTNDYLRIPSQSLSSLAHHHSDTFQATSTRRNGYSNNNNNISNSSNSSTNSME